MVIEGGRGDNPNYQYKEEHADWCPHSGDSKKGRYVGTLRVEEVAAANLGTGYPSHLGHSYLGLINNLSTNTQPYIVIAPY